MIKGRGVDYLPVPNFNYATQTRCFRNSVGKQGARGRLGALPSREKAQKKPVTWKTMEIGVLTWQKPGQSGRNGISPVIPTIDQEIRDRQIIITFLARHDQRPGG
jgi:hypothetical protein